MALKQLHPQIIERDGQREFAVIPWAEFEAIRDLLEDAHDLNDLARAIEAHRDEQPIPYREARKDLDLD